MLTYCINVAHKLGIENPKAAIIGAVEKVNPKMQATLDAAVISKMADRGQIKGAIVDGPLALDVAVSKEHCEIKHLKSSVGGDADILIFPKIETANVFYKSTTCLGNGKIAGVVTGTTAPCILTSRGDTDESKFYSIALAALVAG
jgi:phosphate butyryltransferase